MDRAEAHKLVDKLFDAVEVQPETTMAAVVPEVKETPKDKRVVRTKTSGDRVYLLDEVKKTRQWVTTMEVLNGLGFGAGDVSEVDDSELMKYNMAAAIYKAPNAA